MRFLTGKGRAAIFPALAVLAVGAAWAEPGVTDQEILIGACSVFSGDIKDVGGDEWGGAKAYIDYVNREQGGVHGRKIKVITHDDGYDPNKAIECFNTLMKEGVFVGAFFAGAKTAPKYVEMAKAHQFPVIGMAAGNSFLYDPFNRYIFSVRATYLDETAQEVQHLWEDLGLRKFGVLFQNDALGGSGLKGVTDALNKRGSEPVAIGSFLTNSLDVDNAIQSVRAAKPEVVFIVGGFLSSAEIVKRSKAAGWNPLFVLIPGREEFIKLAGDAADGVVYALLVPPPFKTQLPGVAQFNRLMKKYAGMPPTIKAEEGFIHALVLVEGLKRAGKDLTRERLIQALETMQSVDFGFGPGFEVSFSPSSHHGFSKALFGVVRKGQVVPFSDWKSVVSGRN